MKVLNIYENESEKLIQAKSLLEENGFSCSIEEFEHLAEMNKIIAEKHLDFQIEQLENQISELENLYQEISKKISGFVTMELPSYAIILAGNFLSEISGYSIDTWLSTPNFISTIVHPDFDDYFIEKCNEMKRGIVPKMMEYRITRKGIT